MFILVVYIISNVFYFILVYVCEVFVIIWDVIMVRFFLWICLLGFVGNIM